jgi:hypothetical protein
MAMPVECPSQLDRTPTLRMTHITRRAEKQVEKLLRDLSRRPRERLVSALLGPVPYALCGIVAGQGRHRLFHLRLRCKPAIRVCYAPLSGPDVIVLDVALHDDFDDFAKNFTGSFGTYVPIEESQIMGQHPTNGTATRASQVVSPPRPTHPATPPPALSSAPAGPGAAELLARLLLDSPAFAERKKATDELIAKRTDEAREEAVRKVEGKLQNIETQLAEHAGLLELVQDELVGLQGRLTTATAGIGDRHAKLEAAIEALRENLFSGDAGLASSIASCEQYITTTRADVRTAEERLGDLYRKIEARLDGIDAALAEDRTAPLMAQLDRLADVTERLGEREANHDARLAETADGLRGCRHEMSAHESRLAESDARTRRLEAQVTTLQRSVQELVDQFARERHEREQHSIVARLARLIDTVKSSLAVFGRRRFEA